MQRILLFFIRNRNFLLFALLFFIAFLLTLNARSSHQNKVVTSANFLSGGIYSLKSTITGYFDLKKQNELLSEENTRLRALLQKMTADGLQTDSLSGDSLYRFVPATIVNNNYSKTRNYLTINKGSKDSVQVDMGVISSKGIVGIVSHVSSRYSAVQSVLNTSSEVVAKFKKSNHFGSLKWNAAQPNLVQLVEIPRLAPVAKGDTIVTDGRSTIFPPGIPIGLVSDFSRPEGNDYYDIEVRLFTDMTSVKHVYLVSNTDAPVIKELENSLPDAEQ